ncbi:MAG TPA: STAS domain-containing protein [Actinophytocola sp.]|uniref:STAS domain-containing protein n=1 Tax=Actinophytocola sp. TaxID=1872138 RepID=UPI002DB73C2A|nr:STAS domain-containing protein [Actinophytocola sp.]HEU5472901.1 STAS domain-containing protein [Actinophytocola sp.]
MRDSRFDHPAPEDQLTVDSRHVGGAVVVGVTGEIDIVTAPRLQEAVQDALDRTGHLVVIDLTGVSFMGSTGLAVLAEGDAMARRTGKSLRIVFTRGNHAVHRTIELTGLDRMLAIYDRIDAAVGSE